jgi:hypothetical protein
MADYVSSRRSSSPAAAAAGFTAPRSRGKVVQRRRRLSRYERSVLESRFHVNRHPSADERRELAVQLNMPLHTVQIWFQNRRAKAKLEAANPSAPAPDASPSTSSSSNDAPSPSPMLVLQPSSAPKDASDPAIVCS